MARLLWVWLRGGRFRSSLTSEWWEHRSQTLHSDIPSPIRMHNSIILSLTQWRLHTHLCTLCTFVLTVVVVLIWPPLRQLPSVLPAVVKTAQLNLVIIYSIDCTNVDYSKRNLKVHISILQLRFLWWNQKCENLVVLTCSCGNTSCL